MSEIALKQRDIEVATDTTFVDDHRCSPNPIPHNFFVLRSEQDSSNEHAGWVLVSAWQADEGDVAMGEAEKVGETGLWRISAQAATGRWYRPRQ